MQKTQREITAELSDPELSDPELSGAHLNSVNFSFTSKKEGRVTAVVAKARYQKATENQTKQQFEHSVLGVAPVTPSSKSYYRNS